MENDGTHIQHSTAIEKPMKMIKDKHTYININENDETRVTTIEKTLKTMKNIKTIEQSMKHETW